MADFIYSNLTNKRLKEIITALYRPVNTDGIEVNVTLSQTHYDMLQASIIEDYKEFAFSEEDFKDEVPFKHIWYPEYIKVHLFIGNEFKIELK